MKKRIKKNWNCELRDVVTGEVISTKIINDLANKDECINWMYTSANILAVKDSVNCFYTYNGGNGTIHFLHKKLDHECAYIFNEVL